MINTEHLLERTVDKIKLFINNSVIHLANAIGTDIRVIRIRLNDAQKTNLSTLRTTLYIARNLPRRGKKTSLRKKRVKVITANSDNQSTVVMEWIRKHRAQPVKTIIKD